MVIYSAFPPKWVSVSSEVGAMEHSSAAGQLTLLALGIIAALLLFVKLLQHGRTCELLAALLDLCGNALFYSASAFYFHVTRHTCKNKQIGSQVECC